MVISKKFINETLCVLISTNMNEKDTNVVVKTYPMQSDWFGESFYLISDQ